jgi:hypothetical protein
MLVKFNACDFEGSGLTCNSYTRLERLARFNACDYEGSGLTQKSILGCKCLPTSTLVITRLWPYSQILYCAGKACKVEGSDLAYKSYTRMERLARPNTGDYEGSGLTRKSYTRLETLPGSTLTIMKAHLTHKPYT